MVFVVLVEVLFFVNICVRIKLFKNGLILKKMGWCLFYFFEVISGGFFSGK